MIGSEDAIRAARDAVDATIKDHRNRAKLLYSLRVRLRDRNLRMGVVADLEKVIYIMQEAVNITSEDYTDRVVQLKDLAVRLRYRYSRTGAIAD